MIPFRETSQPKGQRSSSSSRRLMKITMDSILDNKAEVEVLLEEEAEVEGNSERSIFCI